MLIRPFESTWCVPCVEEMGNRAIAERLRCSMEAVKGRRKRLLKSLRTRLEWGARSAIDRVSSTVGLAARTMIAIGKKLAPPFLLDALRRLRNFAKTRKVKEI